MAKFALICLCGSEDFEYLDKYSCFICTSCDTEYSEEEAGKHLLED